MDGRTDGRKDGKTDRHGETSIPPYNLVVGGIKKCKRWKMKLPTGI
jgi:hypothetical protein